MLGPGNSVIVVEPVNEQTTGRQEEVRAEVNNAGSCLREWLIEEVAWVVAQFTKVALSVAVVRGVRQLFKLGFASESAYQRAPDLWTHGHRQQDHRFGSSGYAHPGGSTGTWKPTSSARGGFDQGADHSVPESPRYVTSVDGYHLYLHRKLLSPDRQFWPCPLL